MKSVLGIPGSLRGESSHVRLLRAAKSVSPSDLRLEIFSGMGELPLYNPDLDGETPPEAVLAWRASVGRADGLVISTPEYAHGVPGPLKNALDWLVASVEFPGKRLVLYAGGTHVQSQLEEIVQTMSGSVLKSVLFFGPSLRRAFDPEGVLIDSRIRQTLADSLLLF